MKKFGIFFTFSLVLLAVTALAIGCRIPSDGSDLNLSKDNSPPQVWGQSS